MLAQLTNQTILVTGGSGFFARKFIETVLSKGNPRKIILYSRDEQKHHDMQNSLPFSKFKDKIRYFIGDIRDKDRLRLAVREADIVIHTAALKQVLLAEYNPYEAVKTNILGAQNLVEACLYSDVKKVISISTDKAAAPSGIYGATKLVSDKLFLAANLHKAGKEIKFSVIRYGNVLGSRGSIVPLFTKKKSEGVIPVTDERMTRFNITHQQCVDFVLHCLEVMWGGETFIPIMPSYRIIDLVKAIAPDCRIEITGIRPGEKLHEEVITENEAPNTIEFGNYYVILPTIVNELWDIEKFRLESNSITGKYCEPGFCYNSDNNTARLSIEDIRQLIKIHGS
jgi:UDP-N-acetylglucosamine 4,6-dehydratase/5-epimerase